MTQKTVGKRDDVETDEEKSTTGETKDCEVGGREANIKMAVTQRIRSGKTMNLLADCVCKSTGKK